MASNTDILRKTYEGSSEENGRHLIDALAPDAQWTEAAGFPYAGTYIGADAIIANVFHRLGTEWEGYRAEVHTYLEEGDRVVAFGIYSGTYRATRKSMKASFAHLYQFRDCKIIRMEQYVDSAMVVAAMSD